MQQIHVLENVEAPAYEDTWVTVFGFAVESSTISAVLQEFQTCGNIVMWVHPPAATCNWIYVQFEGKHGAQRALQRNGSRLGLLHILVGVQPPSYQDKQYISTQSKQAFQSQGMAPALPQRQYGLAPTRDKVRSHAKSKSLTCTSGCHYASKSASLRGSRGRLGSQQRCLSATVCAMSCERHRRCEWLGRQAGALKAHNARTGFMLRHTACTSCRRSVCRKCCKRAGGSECLSCCLALDPRRQECAQTMLC